MSTIYHGVTDALIIAPGEQITTANSGLTTLTRTYQCASTYEATAKSILVPGYAPSDYPLLALQTAPIAQRTGSVTVFACTFYGVLSSAAFEQYYDLYSTRNEKASYAYEDYTWVGPYGGTTDALATIQRSGNFGYGAPVISRSYVVPRATMPKVPSLPSSAWSGFPVSVFSEQPPLSTIPTTLQSGYDHTQPTGSDLLTLGYFTRVNSFTVTPYGAANLVVIEYERFWKADGKTINPYAHDPSVLRLSEVDPLEYPPAGNCSVIGLTITAEAYDSSDTLQASLGAGPISVAFDSISNPDVFPVLARGVQWIDANHTTLKGLEAISVSDTLHVLNLEPGSYSIGVGTQKEGGWGFLQGSYVQTQGVPPSPRILAAATSGTYPNYYTSVEIDEAYVGCYADFSMTGYEMHSGGSVITPTNIDGSEETHQTWHFNNRYLDIQVYGVNANGNSKPATTTISV